MVEEKNQYRLANLTDEELKQVSSFEKEISEKDKIVLIAYEKNTEQ